MTATQHETIRAYLGDLISVLDHVSRAVGAQATDEGLKRIVHVAGVVDRMSSVIDRQLTELRAHAERRGGVTSGGAMKDLLTAATGALAGLYGKMRGETASRMLRDDYTALAFVTACSTMLHTTALVFGDAETADLTSRHIDEYPPLIMAVSDLLPHAVIADLGAERITIANADAAEQAVRHISDSWRRASTPHQK